MNNRQWFAHRAEMSNYMPMMIGFKRKRSGWKRRFENIIVWVVIVTYLVAVLGFLVYASVAWGWNPVLVFIPEVVITFKLANRLHEFVYADDSGLHNLPGYDPATGKVAGLEGRDTSKFWCHERPSKRKK